MDPELLGRLTARVLISGALAWAAYRVARGSKGRKAVSVDGPPPSTQHAGFAAAVGAVTFFLVFVFAGPRPEKPKPLDSVTRTQIDAARTACDAVYGACIAIPDVRDAADHRRLATIQRLDLAAQAAQSSRPEHLAKARAELQKILDDNLASLPDIRAAEQSALADALTNEADHLRALIARLKSLEAARE